MHVDGRCHCGRVTYEADVDPNAVSVCHCTDCQVLSGSPWRASIPAPAESFRFTSGSSPPRIYVKTAESGRPRAQAFCGDCGTPIYSADDVNPSTYRLRLGSIVQRAQLKPNQRIWSRSALPWSQDIKDLRTFEMDHA